MVAEEVSAAHAPPADDSATVMTLSNIGVASSKAQVRLLTGPKAKPAVEAEPILAAVDSVEQSAAFPTCIDLPVDEPFFSNALQALPSSPAGEGLAAPASGDAPANAEPVGLDAPAVLNVGPELALLTVPGSASTPTAGSASAPAPGLEDPGTALLGLFGGDKAVTWADVAGP